MKPEPTIAEKEKLTVPKGLRLTKTMAERLDRVVRRRGDDEMDLIRRALGAELDRLEAAGVHQDLVAQVRELAEVVGPEAVRQKLVELASEKSVPEVVAP